MQAAGRRSVSQLGCMHLPTGPRCSNYWVSERLPFMNDSSDTNGGVEGNAKATHLGRAGDTSRRQDGVLSHLS